MQLNITRHHIDITKLLREFITKQFTKLEHYFNYINQVYIVLSVENAANRESDDVCKWRRLAHFCGKRENACSN